MQRSYETTHPWLAFSASRISRAGPRFWGLLGECQSKCEHIAGTPLRPEVAKDLHQLYLAKGALATTAIEGNTLSEAEAIRAVEGTLQVAPSREYLAREIDNVIDAYNRMLAQVAEKSVVLPPGLIADLNGQVLEGLSLDAGVVPGEIRKHSVGVSRYRGAPAEDCEYLLDRLCKWLAGDELAAPGGMEIMFAILRAVLAHLYIAWIHPFGDGNGRTARLVEYLILLSCGVPSPAIHLLSNHYNMTRSEYYRQLERASGSGGDYLPFIEYALQGFADGLREQIGAIRQFQLDVIWTNYVHELFDARKSPVDRRRRDLVLDLAKREGPVLMRNIKDISPRAAEAYAKKTSITVNRDLNILAEMKLVVRTKNGSMANKKIVEAFLPFRAPRTPPVPEDTIAKQKRPAR